MKGRGIGLAVALAVLAGLLAWSGTASAETLRVLLPIGGGYTEEDQIAIAEAYMAAHPDVQVEMEFVGWDALWDRIITSIATGNAPDVIYIASRWIPALADMGAIIPLDPYIDEAKWALYYPAVWESVEYQGQHWGIVRAMSTKALLYNKTLLEAAGVELPMTSWEAILEAARRVHNPPEVYGFGLPANRFVSTVTEFQNWLYANGARITNEEGVATVDSPAAVEAMEFYFGALKAYAQPSP
ncbi:extracellular solute-binding protein, partial [Limnochorda sp.]